MPTALAPLPLGATGHRRSGDERCARASRREKKASQCYRANAAVPMARSSAHQNLLLARTESSAHSFMR